MPRRRSSSKSTRSNPTPAHVPPLRVHKASQQAYANFNGRRVYFGKADQPEAAQRYAAAVAQWCANDQTLPVAPDELTVTELVVAYTKHAEEYFRRPDGTTTNTINHVRDAMKRLRSMYGHEKAERFGPAALRAYQVTMIRAGYTRKTINDRCQVVKRCFRWAASREMLSADVWHRLQTVEGLRLGRSAAKEGRKVGPAPIEDVEAVLRHVSPVVGAMIQTQLLTGARPGEVCGMTPASIDRTGETWIYRPDAHKTAHHGRTREVFIGPKAQSILAGFIERAAGPDARLFTAAESHRWSRMKRTLQRTTDGRWGNRVGTNRVRDPKRKPGDKFTSSAYAAAVRRGCRKAKVTPWTPHQLRHTFATEVRRTHGLEVASLALGHASVQITDAVYAERDAGKIAGVIAKVG